MRGLLALCLISVAGAVVSTYYTAANFNCATHCNMVMSVCNTTNAVYSSLNACLGTCSVFYNNASLTGGHAVATGTNPGGFLELDASGNTFSCRAYHIEAAMTTNDPSYHCPHGGVASPICLYEDPCEGYCSVIMQSCVNSATTSAQLGNGSQWDSYDHCYAGCQNGFEQESSGGYDNKLGLIAASGDDLACRAYHISVSTFLNFHCQHGNVASATCSDGGFVSGTPWSTTQSMCEGFCEYVDDVCDLYSPYDTEEICEAQCNAAHWADATGGYPWPALLSSGNTLGCRIYHASAAISTGQLSTHCPHANTTSVVCFGASTTAATGKTTAATGTTSAATTATSMTTSTSATGTATATSGTAPAPSPVAKSAASGLVPSLLVLVAAAAFA